MSRAVMKQALNELMGVWHSGGGRVKIVIDALRAELAKPVRVPAIPAGWKLVPVEPTADMCKAGGHFMSERLNDYAPSGEALYVQDIKSAYSLMLNAAPPAPEGDAS